MTSNKRHRCNSIEVHVEVSEVLDQIDDDYLIEELEHRGLATGPLLLDDALSYFELARVELLANRPASALALLDRGLFPTAVKKDADGQLSFRPTP